MRTAIATKKYSGNRRRAGAVQIVTGREAVDRELQDHHHLVVICNDMGQPVRSSTAEIRVAVRDVNDNDPVFSATVYNWTIRENNEIGDVIGRVAATDPDSVRNTHTRTRAHPTDSTTRTAKLLSCCQFS